MKLDKSERRYIREVWGKIDDAILNLYENAIEGNRYDLRILEKLGVKRILKGLKGGDIDE